MNFDVRPAELTDVDAIAAAHLDSIRTIGPLYYPAPVVSDWGARVTGDLVGPADGVRLHAEGFGGFMNSVSVGVPEPAVVLFIAAVVLAVVWPAGRICRRLGFRRGLTFWRSFRQPICCCYGCRPVAMAVL